MAVTGRVGIGPIEGGFGIEAETAGCRAGMERERAEALVEAAHRGVSVFQRHTRQYRRYLKVL